MNSLLRRLIEVLEDESVDKRTPNIDCLKGVAIFAVMVFQGTGSKDDCLGNIASAWDAMKETPNTEVLKNPADKEQKRGPEGE